MTHYVVDGEILNNLLGEPSVGNISRLPLQEMKSYETQIGGFSISVEMPDFIKNHEMKSVISALKSIRKA